MKKTNNENSFFFFFYKYLSCKTSLVLVEFIFIEFINYFYVILKININFNLK